MSLLNEIEKLTPFLAPKIWGTNDLTKLKTGEDIGQGLPIGESLEVSCLHSQSSKLSAGQGLDEIINEDDLPYLLKIIDTSDNLSIQVHPDDAYADKFENSMGKTECWLILESVEGAGIFLGLKSTTRKETLKVAIESAEDVSKLLNFYPVSKGDFFYVPAGSIHAIGKGIRLLEVQQNSGVTYRVWDWNRVDEKGISRDLHINKALDVIKFAERNNNRNYFQCQTALFSKKNYSRIVEHRDFIVDLYKIDKLTSMSEITIDGNLKRYSSINVLNGNLVVKRGNSTIELKQYESILIDKSSANEVNISSDRECCFVYVS